MTNWPPSGSETSTADSRLPAHFDRLAVPVRRWIWRRGWTELRDIQARALPLLLDGGGDVVIAAPTASGKTEAAFIPLLSCLADSPATNAGFGIVYVSPLKALINDQFRRLEELCEGLRLPVHKWHGDVPGGAKARASRVPSGVLLITPESLEALFVRRGSEIPRLFGAVQCVVVDELHAMLGTERGIQLQSLLQRMQAAVGRSLRRVGLSATLGDPGLAAASLRPGPARDVSVIQGDGGGQEVRLLLKGYEVGRDALRSGEAAGAIASHLFGCLRGRQNLVFAERRQEVEAYADRLRELSGKARLPNEFFAHHASLSRQHREFVEQRLRRGREPATAVCTSTLELGIDIGEVASIAQIGPPFSVSSARQRLGRSGRRHGRAPTMRTYVTEAAASGHPADFLRLRLVRSIAITELLLQGWCEPPGRRALHLSTLVQQILSVIAERSGALPVTVFDLLCRRGAFGNVSSALFQRVLRAMGRGERPLIEQGPDGTLLLGAGGERIVEHYTFYAVFPTPEEYRVVAAGKDLGTLPADFALVVGSTVVFVGRRWRVDSVDPAAKVIEVSPGPSGEPPRFSGSPGLLHDRVAQEMKRVYECHSTPAYLDPAARRLLEQGRAEYGLRHLDRQSVLPLGPRHTVILPWRGTMVTETLALALASMDLGAAAHDHLLVEVRAGAATVRRALGILASGPAPEPVGLAGLLSNPESRKYHRFLTAGLKRVDAASERIASDALPELAREILGRAGRG